MQNVDTSGREAAIPVSNEDGAPPEGLPEDASLLIVDDDEPFRRRLARAMEKRGFEPVMAESVAEGLSAVRTAPPA
ncbi:MAG: two-component system response regulator, partial [Pseudomonadota bacterium]